MGSFESMKLNPAVETRLVGKKISFPVWWIMSCVIEDPLEAVKMFCFFGIVGDGSSKMSRCSQVTI